MKKNLVLFFCLLFGTAFPISAVGEQVGGGDLVFSPEGAHRVVFSHQLHVEGKGLKCSGCHYHVFQMAKGASKISMSKMAKGDLCGRCHNGQKAFDVNDSKACARCHK